MNLAKLTLVQSQLPDKEGSGHASRTSQSVKSQKLTSSHENILVQLFISHNLLLYYILHIFYMYLLYMYTLYVFHIHMYMIICIIKQTTPD